jgi:hypothetical protein
MAKKNTIEKIKKKEEVGLLGQLNKKKRKSQHQVVSNGHQVKLITKTKTKRSHHLEVSNGRRAKMRTHQRSKRISRGPHNKKILNKTMIEEEIHMTQNKPEIDLNKMLIKDIMIKINTVKIRKHKKMMMTNFLINSITKWI